MNPSILATIGAIIGIVVGSSGMYFSLKDRMTAEVEAAVTEKVTTATRLARLDERLKALEDKSKQ